MAAFVLGIKCDMNMSSPASSCFEVTAAQPLLCTRSFSRLVCHSQPSLLFHAAAVVVEGSFEHDERSELVDNSSHEEVSASAQYRP